MSGSNQTRPGQSKTHAAVTSGGSALSRYQSVVVGTTSFWRTLYFEFCCWMSPIPGALGLLLRKLFWCRLFASCGSGVQFGSGVILRFPGRIRLGENVIVSENVILDARNEASEIVIDIGPDAMLANSVSLSAKGGTITIGAHTGLGAQTIVQSINACPVEIGADVIIGPRCYIVGGSSYNLDKLDVPIRKQGIKPDTGCRIMDNVWLGAGVSVLGGVELASGSVAATGAVVNRSIGRDEIHAGVPARRVRTRGKT